MPGYYLFSAGVTALQAQSQKFDTIRGNIENQSVPGYKAADVRFADLVVPAANGSDEQLMGAKAFQQVFVGKEGTILPSANRFDGALVGSGFYVTRTSFDQGGEIELTDAGTFNETLVEVDGEERVFLTDLAGNFLLGYNADPQTGEINIDTSGVAALEPIEVTRQRALSIANPTTLLSVRGNLSPTTQVGKVENFSFTVLDGTGEVDGSPDDRRITLDFEKTANPNEWELTFGAVNGTVTDPPAQPVTVTFDADGAIESIGGATTFAPEISIDWTNPNVTTPITVNLARFSQFEAPTSVETVNVDGNSDGFLEDAFFGENGTVVGTFSNGISRPIAQLALGDVVAPERMTILDDNHYRVNQNSGDLNLYDFNDTTRATFQPFALEQSTTEITQEFTNLIVTQRAYSSAAQTIRTVDEMMQTATNLKN